MTSITQLLNYPITQRLAHGLCPAADGRNIAVHASSADVVDIHGPEAVVSVGDFVAGAASDASGAVSSVAGALAQLVEGESAVQHLSQIWKLSRQEPPSGIGAPHSEQTEAIINLVLFAIHKTRNLYHFLVVWATFELARKPVRSNDFSRPDYDSIVIEMVWGSPT